jgi:hypothetical protein
LPLALSSAAGIGTKIMAGRKDELKAKANGAAPQVGSGSMRGQQRGRRRDRRTAPEFALTTSLGHL